MNKDLDLARPSSKWQTLADDIAQPVSSSSRESSASEHAREKLRISLDALDLALGKVKETKFHQMMRATDTASKSDCMATIKACEKGCAILQAPKNAIDNKPAPKLTATAEHAAAPISSPSAPKLSK